MKQVHIPALAALGTHTLNIQSGVRFVLQTRITDDDVYNPSRVSGAE